MKKKGKNIFIVSDLKNKILNNLVETLNHWTKRRKRENEK